MAKVNGPEDKAADKALTGKEEVIAKTEQAGISAAKMKPIAEKAKVPAKQAANEAAAGKEKMAVKTEQTKNGSEKKKAIAEEAETFVEKSANKAEEAKDSFTGKMEAAKGTAADVEKKTADNAKVAGGKPDSLEDMILYGLHEIKKALHRVAVKIIEKTKEK